MIVVHYHRVGDVQPFDGFFNVCHLFLEGEFGGVVADDDKAFIFEALVPRACRRDLPDAVDSAKGPHFEQDDLPFEVFYLKGAAVEPGPRHQFRGKRAGFETRTAGVEKTRRERGQDYDQSQLSRSQFHTIIPLSIYYPC
jgi:hypothetical protein